MPTRQIIHQRIVDQRLLGKKAVALLIDPDKIQDQKQCIRLVNQANEEKVDFILVGGSLITHNNFSQIVWMVKKYSGDVPVILFPGSNMQIDPAADAILFLSLISGRNPDLLIGQHVLAAPILKKSSLEIISTGYILVGNSETTVAYMSNTQPIPLEKSSVAVCTALAGELLGQKMIYLDAGSGARQPVPHKMIAMVKKSISIPLIVGGGLNSVTKCQDALKAGADVIVIGNGVEKNPDFLSEVCEKVSLMNRSLDVH